MSNKPQPFSDRQHMRTGTYEVFHYKDAKPRDVALHHHDFYEVYFFLSGKVQYNIESRSYLLVPGDVLLIRPMELHQPVFDHNPAGYERIVLWLNQSFLDQFGLPGEPLNSCFNAAAPGRANLLRPDETSRVQILYQLELLMAETNSTEYGHEISALSSLAQILVQLCRSSNKEPQEVEPTDSSDVVYRILGYINDHCSEDLSLDFLANRFFISKYHLSREFARITGSSVHRYIIQRRLMTARQMMVDGASSTEVYQRCGFGDYSNFFRAFKAEYQMSPREFSAYLKKAASVPAPQPHFFREFTE